MKNEDFRLDKERIDDEMNEMFAFDEAVIEKTTQDAMKEKMRSEAKRKNARARNRLIVSTAAALAVVVTSVTLLPSLFGNDPAGDDNDDNRVLNAPGTGIYGNKNDIEADPDIEADLDGGISQDTEIAIAPFDPYEVSSEFSEFTERMYRIALKKDQVLIASNELKYEIFDGAEADKLQKMREVMTAKLERELISSTEKDGGSDEIYYVVPEDEVVPEDTPSTTAAVEEVIDTVALDYYSDYTSKDRSAEEAVDIGEMYVMSEAAYEIIPDNTVEETTHVTNKNMFCTDDADLVIIYSDGCSIAVWLIIESDSDHSAGLYRYFDFRRGETYSPSMNSIDEPTFIYETDFDGDTELYEEMFDMPNKLNKEIDTDTPNDDTTIPDRGYTLYVNGDPYDEYTSADRCKNLCKLYPEDNYLKEMYLACNGIFSEEIFKIGVEYDEDFDFDKAEAIDLDASFNIVSTQAFELEFDAPGYAATYNIPEKTPGCLRAYCVYLSFDENKADDYEVIQAVMMFIDGSTISEILTAE